MFLQANKSNLTAVGFGERNYLLELLPVAASIVIANSVVFVLFASTRSLRTPSNFFLLSLAICDFFNGLINNVLFTTTWTLFSRGIRLSNAAFFAISVLHNFTVIITSFHILAITTERYFAIVRPLQRRLLLTKRVAVKVVVFIWLMSGVLTALLVSLKPGSVAEKVFNIALTSWIFILLLLMGAAYTIMFRTLNKRRIHISRSSQSHNATKIVNERKCLLVFAMMVVVFGVCWCPWFVIRLVVFHPGLYEVVNAYTKIRYLSSVINPLLYTLFKNDFQQALRSFFCKRERRQTETNQATFQSDHTKRLSAFFSNTNVNKTETDNDKETNDNCAQRTEGKRNTVNDEVL